MNLKLDQERDIDDCINITIEQLDSSFKHLNLNFNTYFISDLEDENSFIIEEYIENAFTLLTSCLTINSLGIQTILSSKYLPSLIKLGLQKLIQTKRKLFFF